MQTRRAKAPSNARRGWFVPALALVAVLAGLFFRAGHLERKVYWDDETYTSIRIAGLTEAELVERAAQFQRMGDLQAALQPVRDRRPVGDTVASLASEDPQHPPLYYVAAYFWSLLFGTSVAAIRSFSALLGILALPLMFWLCWELFRSRRAAFLGTALIAVSPIFVLYSQEAREYVLWVDTTLWMSAAFLRALRLESVAAWSFYALALAAGLYAYPLTLLVLLAHAIVVPGERERLSAALKGFLLAAAAGLLAFVPWLLIMFRQQRQMLTGLNPSVKIGFGIVAEKTGALALAKRFLGQVRLGFLDVNPLQTGALQGAGTLLVLALVAYCAYVLVRGTPRRTWLFVVALLAAPALPLLLGNLTLAGFRTSIPRYFLPFYIALLLAVAGGASLELERGATRARRAAWQTLLVVVLSTGILSCALSARAETWWNKLNDNSRAIARIVADSPSPLVAGDNQLDYSLVLSYYLPGDTKIALRPRCYLCRVAQGRFSPDDVARMRGTNGLYVLGPSADMKAELAQGGAAPRCISIYEGVECPGELWIYPSGW